MPVTVPLSIELVTQDKCPIVPDTKDHDLKRSRLRSEARAETQINTKAQFASSRGTNPHGRGLGPQLPPEPRPCN